MEWCYLMTLVCLVLYTSYADSSTTYDVDDSPGLGRRFDGIGGLSGGGATSRLLVDYDKEHLDQILDFLFLPNFGASLQILKVEIGGDAQSTDGTEPSHMHSPDDENYQRGYEWWLMKEAKKRNPNIKLYGLPWGWPGWISPDPGNPYINPDITAKYIINWINGAKTEHNLTIDYVGIWNEKKYSIEYIKRLRGALDESGFSSTQIIASDGKFQICKDVLHDTKLNESIFSVGVHYPGTEMTLYCLETNKTLWSSEDFSTFNDNVGAGCWARILNQNFVNGYMTSTISWNLIASYYNNLPYFRDGLMTAIEPWSGHYTVESPIWMTAHTTQFTQPGWNYLKHNHGVYGLDERGSMVSLTNGKDLTIIIETMSHDHSKCIRPPLPAYTIKNQTATVVLKGSFAKLTHLNVWYSKLEFDGKPSNLFSSKSPVTVKNGTFMLNLGIDEIWTLTTLTTGKKGAYPASPPTKPFPIPYFDNFDQYPIYSEAMGFADQSGVFEIRDSGDPKHKLVMQQVAEMYPIRWCFDSLSPISYIGNHSWSQYEVSVDAFIGTDEGGVSLAVRIYRGGCGAHDTPGLFFWVYANGTYLVSSSIIHSDSLSTGKVPVASKMWFNLGLIVDKSSATGTVNGKQVFHLSSIPSIVPKVGFVGIGAIDFGQVSPVMFDNFNLTKAIS